MLNENLNRFKRDSTRFQQAFNIFLCFQQCWTTCSNAQNIWFNKVLNTRWSKCWNRTLICHGNRKDVVTLGNILRVSGIHPPVTFHEKLQQRYAKIVVADCYIVLMQFSSVSFCWKRQFNYFEQFLKSLFKWRKWLILFALKCSKSPLGSCMLWIIDNHVIKIKIKWNLR